jgi:hypothetical protein
MKNKKEECTWHSYCERLGKFLALRLDELSVFSPLRSRFQPLFLFFFHESRDLQKCTKEEDEEKRQNSEIEFKISWPNYYLHSLVYFYTSLQNKKKIKRFDIWLANVARLLDSERSQHIYMNFQRHTVHTNG